MLGRIDRVHAAAPYVVNLPQTWQRTVENRDICTEADSHIRSIESRHAATNHNNLGWCDAGHSTQQYTTTTIGFLQVVGARLNGQAACNFRHRRQ